jgi:hypothetical protein
LTYLWARFTEEQAIKRWNCCSQKITRGSGSTLTNCRIDTPRFTFAKKLRSKPLSPPFQPESNLDRCAVCGVPLFPTACTIANNNRSFEEMMRPRQEPRQGALVVFDELLDYLRSRNLSDHPNPAIDDHFKTGQREMSRGH